MYKIGSLKQIEHFQALVAIGVQLSVQFVHVGRLRHMFGKNHHHAFCLPDSFVGDIFHGGQVFI